MRGSDEIVFLTVYDRPWSSSRIRPRLVLELHGNGRLILIGHGSMVEGIYRPGEWDTATTVNAEHLHLIQRAARTEHSGAVLLEAIAEVIGERDDAEIRFREWLDSNGIPSRHYPDWRTPK
ncbi:hypothetical protein SAMN05216276_1003297 [Streptosporangium subroseum]|uniref:Immunity protein 8 n=1 Tax=Streptosporangium subroseum TaxID=106412 RepID=A0A239BMD4_9ACTN|nr:hypothetical protein [Streptosporangium subroseum]SNS08508.1 hypothetical protein SAMN05216276_1003297 [Streptosporangium subroseum]